MALLRRCTATEGRSHSDGIVGDQFRSRQSSFPPEGTICNLAAPLCSKGHQGVSCGARGPSRNQATQKAP